MLPFRVEVRIRACSAFDLPLVFQSRPRRCPKAFGILKQSLNEKARFICIVDLQGGVRGDEGAVFPLMLRFVLVCEMIVVLGHYQQGRKGFCYVVQRLEAYFTLLRSETLVFCGGSLDSVLD